MPLTTSQAGRRYPAEPPYEVGREKIREFARAVGERNPACVDPAAARALGHRDLLAPPTFLALLVHRATDRVLFDPELGLDYDRVVHRDQHFLMHRPVCAGDRLTVVVEIAAARSTPAGELLELAAEVADEEGCPVARVSMSLAVRPERPGGGTAQPLG